MIQAGSKEVPHVQYPESLVRKPGAFAHYRYREDLFPTFTFRRAYDILTERSPERRADLEYLRVLQLAAETMECEVETAISLLLEQGELPTAGAIKDLVRPEAPAIPEVVVNAVDLGIYDSLLDRQLWEAAS